MNPTIIAMARTLKDATSEAHKHQKGKPALLAHAYLALESAAASLREADDARSNVVELVAETLSRAYEQNRLARRLTLESQLAAEGALRDALKASPYSLDDLVVMAEQDAPGDWPLVEFCEQLVRDRNADDADIKNGHYL